MCEIRIDKVHLCVPFDFYKKRSVPPDINKIISSLWGSDSVNEQ
jgi:hypothetical protein